MAKTSAKKSNSSPGRLLAKATTVKSNSKIKLPGKPAPKPAKTVKVTKQPPIPVKPAKTQPPATKVGQKGVLTPDRAAIAGKAPAVKPPVAKTAVAKAPAKPIIPPGAVAITVKPSQPGATKPAPVASKPPVPKAPPQIIPPPVATDGKPRKNQAGLTAKELEFYRELLLQKRRELVGDMSSMEREALRSPASNLSNMPVHIADQGTDNYEQEFTLGLVEKDRNLLREINRALQKIQDGTYGICEGTGKPISKPRLEAQPWAKYSIEYARELEKGGVRR